MGMRMDKIVKIWVDLILIRSPEDIAEIRKFQDDFPVAFFQ
jgi:hypothetical protein